MTKYGTIKNKQNHTIYQKELLFRKGAAILFKKSNLIKIVLKIFHTPSFFLHQIFANVESPEITISSPTSRTSGAI